MFAKARDLTLNLAQWLARIGNSYVAGDRPDDRVSLSFSRGSFVTKSFEREFVLELRLPSLEMQFQERGKPVPHILNPEEHSPAETEAWILVELLHRGVERDKFSKSLPYVIENSHERRCGGLLAGGLRGRARTFKCVVLRCCVGVVARWPGRLPAGIPDVATGGDWTGGHSRVFARRCAARRALFFFRYWRRPSPSHRITSREGEKSGCSGCGICWARACGQARLSFFAADSAVSVWG